MRLQHTFLGTSGYVSICGTVSASLIGERKNFIYDPRNSFRNFSYFSISGSRVDNLLEVFSFSKVGSGNIEVELGTQNIARA